ncbi:hypothetical protein [Parasphaerochaeta coccoides]|uniref:Head decoration protein n=1 Tax=Parasphaerochaeta coccoides (strain ATCC BAA-1237 / DSM 17374 / SPN1) TaxID=760011 RepID=F4GHE0_PARC1|nr:hypothetical protein [Parasphaerochaeta coccoides]AEC02039.1 hypothetical protein Spico_0814 [Parasphaerochaeta coccoides DSM 17374]
MQASKTMTIEVSEIVDGRHPALIIRKEAVKGKGQIVPGQILAIKDGKVLPYVKGDSTAGTAFGVATTPADTAQGKDDGVNVLVHGTCRAALVVTGSGVADQADLDALALRGVWAF